MGLPIWVLRDPSPPEFPSPLKNLPWFITKRKPAIRIVDQGVNNTNQLVQNCFVDMGCARISQNVYTGAKAGQDLFNYGGWATLGPILSHGMSASGLARSHFTITVRHQISDNSSQVTIFSPNRPHHSQAIVRHRSTSHDWVLLQLQDLQDLNCVLPSIAACATRFHSCKVSPLHLFICSFY